MPSTASCRKGSTLTDLDRQIARAPDLLTLQAIFDWTSDALPGAGMEDADCIIRPKEALLLIRNAARSALGEVL